MQNLKIQLVENLGLIPPVLSLLAGDIPNTYGWYKLRHPGGIFNIQFLAVNEDLLQVLDDLKEISIGTPGAISTPQSPEQLALARLMRDYGALLFSFTNYLESAYEILVAFCPQHTLPSENEFLWRWLKNKGYPAGKHFHNDVVDDVQFFRTVFNKLKHTSNRLRPNVLYERFNNELIVAYYLESPSSSGALGPDEVLHPRSQGVATANSFNRDLRRIYFDVYLIAVALETRLKQHYQQIYQKELMPNLGQHQDDSIFRKVCEQIRDLRSAFAPSEFGQETPVPSIREEQGKKSLIFEISKPLAPATVDYIIAGNTSGDGFTRAFTFPYFNP